MLPAGEGGKNVSESKALAFFDFDGTMLRGDSITAYLRMAWKQGFLSLREYAAVIWHTVRFFLGMEQAEETKGRALRFLGAMTPEQQRAFDEAFVRQELLPRLFPQALSAWEAHRQAGRKLLLVSASTDNYMRLISQALGADALLCTVLSAEGIVKGNCKGDEKVRRIRAWLDEQGWQADFSSSYAYGDSKSDLPMLRLVGHPIQVNPKKALRAAAPDMSCVHWTEAGK